MNGAWDIMHCSRTMPVSTLVLQRPYPRLATDCLIRVICCPPDADDVDIQFARSSGAGGQNVNKARGARWAATAPHAACVPPTQPPCACRPGLPTQRMLAALVATSSACPPWFLAQVNTKVDMRLRLDAAPWLDDEVREAVRRMVRPPAGLQKPRSNLALGVRLFALHPGLNACLSSSTMLSARVTGPQRSCLSCRRLAPGVPVHHVALLAGPAGEEAHQQGGRACHHIAAHAVAGVSKSKTVLAWLPCTVQGRPCASSTCPQLLPIMCGPCHHALSAASTHVRGQRRARSARAGASLPDACFPPPLLPYQPLFMRLQLEACIEFHPAETTWRMLC